MSNIYIYKIEVKGKKLSCYKLINIVPSFTNKQIIEESGDSDNFRLVFSGKCNGYIDLNTKIHKGIEPFRDDEIKNIQEGDFLNNPLFEKAIILNAEIKCQCFDLNGNKILNKLYYLPNGKEGKITKENWPEILNT